MGKIRKNASAIWICFGVVSLVAGIILNFNHMVFGSVRLSDTIVTIGYIAFWGLYLIFNARMRTGLTFSIVLSAISFISAIMGFITMLFDVTFGGMVYIAAVFLTPLYGIRYMAGTFDLTYIILIFCSAVWLGVSIVLRKRLLNARVIG